MILGFSKCSSSYVHSLGANGLGQKIMILVSYIEAIKIHFKCI